MGIRAPPHHPAHSPNNLKRIKATENRRPEQQEAGRVKNTRAQVRTWTVEKKKWHQPVVERRKATQHSEYADDPIGLGETGMTVMAGVAGRCCEKLSASYFESAAIVLQ